MFSSEQMPEIIMFFVCLLNMVSVPLYMDAILDMRQAPNKIRKVISPCLNVLPKISIIMEWANNWPPINMGIWTNNSAETVF